MDEIGSLSGSDADYPSQDGVDRRGHFAIVAHASILLPDNYAMDQIGEVAQQFRPFYTAFPNEISDAVVQAVREVVGLDLFPKPIAVHYQIGPAAGGIG